MLHAHTAIVKRSSHVSTSDEVKIIYKCILIVTITREQKHSKVYLRRAAINS